MRSSNSLCRFVGTKTFLVFATSIVSLHIAFPTQARSSGTQNTPPAKAKEAVSPAPNTDFPVDELLAAIRRQSVHRHQVDWATVEPEIKAKVARANTDAEKAKAIVQLFAKMNDVHSNLQVGGQSYGHYEGLDEEARRKLLPLLERERAQSGKVKATLLEKQIGYVLVPAMPAYNPEQIDKFARDLRGRAAELSEKKPAGWIVDLRLNGGGNLYPMLLGLSALLGEGVVGGTIDADGKLVHEWVLKDDGLYWRENANERRFAALDLSLRSPAATAPVAVLVGPMTRSSGQATALAFQGRPRCLMLGEPTAKGYTTVTNPSTFGPNVTLSLSVGYMADRKGTACKSQVLPEKVVVDGDAFDDLKEDRKVRAAIEWINKQSK